MKSNKILIFLLLSAIFVLSKSEEEENEEGDYVYDEISEKVAKLKVEGAEYLQKVMKQLQNDKIQTQTVEVPDIGSPFYTQRIYDMDDEKGKYAVTQIYNISGPTPVPDIEAEVVPQAVPPIALSKEELLALYEAALVKASQLPLLQGGKPEEEVPELPSDEKVKPALQGQMGSPVSGYYYYYFPIKSFLKPKPEPASSLKVTPAHPQQLHATVTMVESPNNKSVEPLFMAISGFIGMALMFFFSILFMPKFSKIRSKNAQFKDATEDMATFTQILLEAMAGKDCSERLACEITRVFRGLKSNNKPLRVLEIILPPNLSQQISQIRKAAGKKARCGYIPCKIKKPKPKPPAQKEKPKPQAQNQKPKPWKKKETPHDLWMKHFEKQKIPPRKQHFQENSWNRRPIANST